MKSTEEQLKDAEKYLVKLSTTLNVLDELYEWATNEKQEFSVGLIDEESSTLEEFGQVECVPFKALRLKMAKMLQEA